MTKLQKWLLICLLAFCIGWAIGYSQRCAHERLEKERFEKERSNYSVEVSTHYFKMMFC